MAEKIKEYSSDYATKLAYVLAKQAEEVCKGLVTYVSEVTTEKDTTTKNWLFNGKLPREPKRIVIADAIGTSMRYLFDESVRVKKVTKPEVEKVEGCYLIPLLSEDDIFRIFEKAVFPIKERIPVMVPNFDKLIKRFGKNIYATKLQNSNFQPYISDDSILICSEKIMLEEYKFILVRSEGKSLLRRVIMGDSGQLQLMHYDQNGDEILESIQHYQDALLVLFAISL